MNHDAPYLSIVVTARNDDHGGNQLARMQLFLDNLGRQFQKYQLDAELVLVEWNPPPDKTKLREALRWPEGLVTRIIEVPPEIHSRFEHSDKLKLFQMIAKNVAIRRAKGKFILATNIDIIFDDELIEYIAREQLKPGSFYRTDRYDVPANSPWDGLISWCKANSYAVDCREGTFKLKHGYPYKPKSLAVRVAWTLLVRSKRLLRIITLWLLSLSIRKSWNRLSLSIRKAWNRLLDFQPIVIPTYLRNIVKLIAGLKRFKRLHTNACGDFTLMAKEHWFDLKGYPEFEMYSIHIDSLLCYMAYHAGLAENVLNWPVFHIDHGGGWIPAIAHQILAGVKAKGLPYLDYRDFLRLRIQIARERKTLVFNKDSWGLSEEDLAETIINEANYEKLYRV